MHCWRCKPYIVGIEDINNIQSNVEQANILHIIAASNAIKLGETGHINFIWMVYGYTVSLAKAIDST